MSSPKYGSKRKLRSEIFPLASVFGLVFALYLAFPSGVVDFEPSEPKAGPVHGYCFISLEPEREAKLLADARASWQTDSASRRGQRADLLRCDLQEMDVRIASGLRPPSPADVDPVAEYEIDFIPAGVAAGAPALLQPLEPPAPVPAFTREELLKLK